MLAVPALRLAARTQARAFSLSALRSSEGMPSGHGTDAFKKREKGQEDAYVRDAEREKLKALKKSIEASKAHLAELEKSHGELEQSLNGSGDKKH
ncbi:hypothetical protein JCM3770_001502 [Rhodotorula araucariae]